MPVTDNIDENRMKRELAFTRSLNGIEVGSSFDTWCDKYGEPTLVYHKEWPCLGGNTTANKNSTKCTRNFMKGLETTLVLKTNNGPMYLTWPDKSAGCIAFSKCICYSNGSIYIEYICSDSNKIKTKDMNIVFGRFNRSLNLKLCLNKIYKTKH